MAAPILDFHTHAQDCYDTCCVHPLFRPLARNGLERLWEKTRFAPSLKRLDSKFSHRLIAREMQARFVGLSFDAHLTAMQQNGVTFACALPIEPMARTRDLLALAAGQPSVIPFASVDFTAADPAAQVDAHLAAGCRGVKIHPIMQAIAPDDERVVAVFERLRGTGVPVIFHSGHTEYFLGARPESPDAAEPARFVPLLRRFPSQTVVLGHMGLLASRAALDVAAEFPNVYLETSFQHVGSVRAALARIGPRRILLGSDWPATEPRTEIAIVRAATRGDAAAERRILFENGAELLARAGWSP